MDEQEAKRQLTKLVSEETNFETEARKHVDAIYEVIVSGIYAKCLEAKASRKSVYYTRLDDLCYEGHYYTHDMRYIADQLQQKSKGAIACKIISGGCLKYDYLRCRF